MNLIRLYLILLVLISSTFVCVFVFIFLPKEIETIDFPKPIKFSDSQIERGFTLSMLGNCSSCHTKEGGDSYAGGKAIKTDFGIIYSSNITFDPNAGIGGWSLEAFKRAMTQGINREGKHLYPAFPYDRFKNINDNDLEALYAYLSSEVMHSNYKPQETKLSFPWNLRFGLYFWKKLFLDKSKWKKDLNMDEEWNLGSYLVEGIAHCGSCHSPRNFLGAEKKGELMYTGGLSGDWFSPNLKLLSSNYKYHKYSLVDYLIDGWDESLGIASGPMTKVVNNLYDIDEDYIFAIAKYINSLNKENLLNSTLKSEKKSFVIDHLQWGHPNEPPLNGSIQFLKGAEVFKKNCSTCHKYNSKASMNGFVNVIKQPEPNNLIQVILEGINNPPFGSPDRQMPSRHFQVDNKQLVSLLVFLRKRYSFQDEWKNLEQKVSEFRSN